MKIFRLFLQTIGVLALAGVVLVALLVAYAWRSADTDRTASKADAAFILHDAGISPGQDWELLGSALSSRSLTGDHLDQYCLQLQRFDPDSVHREDWRHGPEDNPLPAEAVRFGLAWVEQEAIPCFSADVSELRRFRVNVRKVVLHARRPTAAKFMLFEPETMRLLYVSYKT